MSNQELVGKVHAHINKEIARLSDNYIFYTSPDYLILRDLPPTQITILNAQRGELARLIMHQWKETLSDEWLMREPTGA